MASRWKTTSPVRRICCVQSWARESNVWTWWWTEQWMSATATRRLARTCTWCVPYTVSRQRDIAAHEVSAIDWYTLDNRTHDCCTEHCVVYTVRSRDISAQFVWLHDAFCVRENCSCDVAISHARSVYAIRGSRPFSDEEHIRIVASFCAFPKFGLEKLVYVRPKHSIFSANSELSNFGIF